MSRSKRLPIIKDKPRNYKRTSAYWRPIRRIINQMVSTYKVKYDDAVLDLHDDEAFDSDINVIEKNSIMLGTELPNPKTIINDYAYCDYITDYRYMRWWFRDEEELKEEIKQISRK